MKKLIIILGFLFTCATSFSQVFTIKETSGAPVISSLELGEAVLVEPDDRIYIRKDATTLISFTTGAGGTTKEYASFYLGTGGLTNQSGTANTVVINNTSVNSNGSVFSLAGNSVTINKTGNFKIDFDCYFNNSSTSRTEYTFWLEKNLTEIDGSRSGNYQRGYDSGQASSISMIIPVTSGDIIRVRVNRTDGSATTGYQDDNGTRLTITEM